MENKNEELSKEIEKEFNGLEVLPYEKMIEILNDQENHTLIWFTHYKDILYTGNVYHYVQVRDISNDKHSTYRAPDQNDKLIEENLYKAIEMSPIEGQFGYFESDWADEFFCKIGGNAIHFPTSVAKRIINEYHETSQIQSEFKLTSKRREEFNEKVKVKSKSLKPENLDPGELPFEI